jgi:hypothetical protein
MKVKSMNKVIMTGLCLLSTAALGVQTCFDTLNETNVIDNFTQLNNGLVQDNITGLMWTRCAYGQTWDNTNLTCLGTPVQITWQDALQLSTTITDGNYSDWRLPNVKELATIVEKRCVEPSVNAILFPATSAENFWSSTTATSDATRAWAIAFYNGKNNTKEKLVDLHVRFVRFAL